MYERMRRITHFSPNGRAGRRRRCGKGVMCGGREEGAGNVLLTDVQSLQYIPQFLERAYVVDTVVSSSSSSAENGSSGGNGAGIDEDGGGDDSFGKRSRTVWEKLNDDHEWREVRPTRRPPETDK